MYHAVDYLYTAPEVDGIPTTPVADVWSVGCVLLAACSTQLLDASTTQAVLTRCKTDATAVGDVVTQLRQAQVHH